jgi:hypothetical protein
VKPATNPYPQCRAHDEKEEPHDPCPTTARQAGIVGNDASSHAFQHAVDLTNWPCNTAHRLVILGRPLGSCQ